MNLRKRFAFRSRKGFALILVFSLASIVLLLALSLVSLTQVESASSRYDQGLRVARANARLALQMALGDLQEFAGPDQRITATADGMRQDGAAPSVASFNDSGEPNPAGNGMVYEPFWTGVWRSDGTTTNPVWLVTRPLSADYTLENGTQMADPFSPVNGSVPLVGRSSAEPDSPVDQPFYNVTVPKEKINSSDIVGFEDKNAEATIGHYAYWVGDNGVKASYLIEDHVFEVTHDNYANDDERMRLGNMMGHRSHFEVENTLVNVGNARLKSIANEFALRDPGEGTSLLGTGVGFYTKNDVRKRFHDFAGLSRGLLVDTVRGGLKKDLSDIDAVNTGDATTDELVNEYLMPYLNVDSLTITAPTELTRSYSIRNKYTADPLNPASTVAPLITEFNFRVWLSTPGFNDPPQTQSNVYCKFGVSVELWNPYTSSIEGETLIVRILNLDEATDINVKYFPTNYPTEDNLGMSLGMLMNGQTDFVVRAPNGGESWWSPGELKTFTGAYRGSSSNAGDLDPIGVSTLNPGVSFPLGIDYRYEVPHGTLPRFTSPDWALNTDQISLEEPIGGAFWNPVVGLFTVSGDELYRFELDGISFNQLKSSPNDANSVATPHLSYKWELRHPDSNWANNDPRSGLITSELIMDYFDDPNDPPVGYDPISMGYFEYPGSNKAFTESTIQTSAVDLLAANADGNVKNNIPIFELPRQEFVSLAGLQHAEFPSGVRHQLGMPEASNPSTSINDAFDRFFLSTVPQANPTMWTVDDPLPNGRMRPVSDSTEVDFQDANSAEHLYLEGAFNINSTSVEAWTALLKGVRLGTWDYQPDPDDVDDPGSRDFSNENQFLRFSQSAEESWMGSFDMDDGLERTRSFFRKGLRSLTDGQVTTLATGIVKGVRNRRQSVAAPTGPFVSLQDFIDTGVVETAITSSGINDSIRMDTSDPLTELPYTSSYLTQQDVLTAIAPFLSARSDTFVVRAYGDAVNPFDADEIVARAYCEAIVQRMHEKHETEYENGAAGNLDPMLATLGTEGHFGRKFKVIAFRWMTGDEL